MSDTCNYSRAWIGGCGRPAVERGFCAEHAAATCRVCGKQATQECSYCGQFVCGTTLCRNCEGYEDRSKPSGSWGFMNHSHRRREGSSA